MAPTSSSVYRFGDMLALARQSWVAQVRDGLSVRGYPDYRRSDALVLRLLRRGPMAIGRLGDALGVTRQAARKVADALARRGFATTERDVHDERQINITLTVAGEAFARSVAIVTDELSRELAQRVAPADLMVADTVLRAVLVDTRARELAERVPPPT